MSIDMPSGVEPGKILIVDDEANIRKGLRAVLLKDGHDVRDVAGGDEALKTLETFACEAAIVDIRMPGMSGVELLQEIRGRWPTISVVLLTGHGTLETAMAAVKEGAQDYLLKPAQPDTIRQTVTAALTASRQRREQARFLDSLRSGLQRLENPPAGDAPAREEFLVQQASSHIISVADLEIDIQAHAVSRDGKPISLTPSEFQLLVALGSRAGQVVDYVTLVQLTLDYEADPWEAKELIKRHIFSLRKKIEPEPSAPRYIVNVRGIGYRLTAPRDLS
jgi:DNA-binding response OmpR family regulator